MNLESVILTELNADASSWVHLSNHDRERIAKRIAVTLEQEDRREKAEAIEAAIQSGRV